MDANSSPLADVAERIEAVERRLTAIEQRLADRDARHADPSLDELEAKLAIDMRSRHVNSQADRMPEPPHGALPYDDSPPPGDTSSDPASPPAPPDPAPVAGGAGFRWGDPVRHAEHGLGIVVLVDRAGALVDYERGYSLYHDARDLRDALHPFRTGDRVVVQYGRGFKLATVTSADDERVRLEDDHGTRWSLPADEVALAAPKWRGEGR